VVPNRGRIKAIEVLKALEANQVTHALMVPTIIQQLQPFLSQVTLPHLKLSQFCGEGLPYEACKNWANCLPNAKVQNVYGPTEATIYCTSYDCDFASDVKTYHGIICMGEPFGSNQCRVNLGTSKDRFEGELMLGGPQLSLGYYKNEKQTELVFYETDSERVYRTGDVVFRDDEGKLYFVGRNDQQVQIQGHRVELGEIEEACRSCGANTAVAVMVEVKNSARVVVYINEFEGADVLEKRLSSHLPEYMLPHQVQVLEIFPLNNNGKIDRKVLKERGLS
jgi:non-ribosomal peptide synthetase component F